MGNGPGHPDRGSPGTDAPQRPADLLPGGHTPKGRLGTLEKELLDRPWAQVREGVEVKLLPRDGELYVLAQSQARVCKERAMRKRQLKKLWKRLKQLQTMDIKRDDLLIKLGQAKSDSPAGWRLVQVEVGITGALSYSLRKDNLREVRRREGRYLLRSNLCDRDPAVLWQLYMLLTQIEEAFKNLKGDLPLRPIHHQLEHRIEAHIFVAFLAYCLHVTLRHRLRLHAPGMTPRTVIEKLATIQMLDAHFPTTDGRWLIFARHTQPEKDHRMLINLLGLQLPAQRPPRITHQKKLSDS